MKMSEKKSSKITKDDKMSVKLYLGFPLDKIAETKLSASNPFVLKTFIQEGENYLEEITLEGCRYLGKILGDITDLQKLELSEANIYSLINKLLPDLPIKNTPLILFTVPS